jgi:hypothetical protein
LVPDQASPTLVTGSIPIVREAAVDHISHRDQIIGMQILQKLPLHRGGFGLRITVTQK